MPFYPPLMFFSLLLKDPQSPSLCILYLVRQHLNVQDDLQDDLQDEVVLIFLFSIQLIA